MGEFRTNHRIFASINFMKNVSINNVVEHNRTHIFCSIRFSLWINQNAGRGDTQDTTRVLGMYLLEAGIIIIIININIYNNNNNKLINIIIIIILTVTLPVHGLFIDL